MPYSSNGKVKFWQSDLFGGLPVTHAVLTRKGGVSTGQWAELNVGLTVGDDPERVIANRKTSFEALGRDYYSMSDSWLVHDKGVVVYDEPRDPKSKVPPKADIILTDNPEVTLFMRCADCVPLLLYDSKKQAIGLVHSGWLGTTKKVGAKAVEAMTERYGSNPTDILAVVGPSISPDKYEVGDDVIKRVREIFKNKAEELLPKVNGNTHFDLWASNEFILREAGVEQVDVSGICTATHTDLWFSHRAENGKTGRFGALIGLEK